MTGMHQPQMSADRAEVNRIWSSVVVGEPTARPELNSVEARYDGAVLHIRSDVLTAVRPEDHPSRRHILHIFSSMETYPSQLLSLPGWTAEEARNASKEVRRVLGEYSAAMKQEFEELDKARAAIPPLGAKLSGFKLPKHTAMTEQT